MGGLWALDRFSAGPRVLTRCRGTIRYMRAPQSQSLLRHKHQRACTDESRASDSFAKDYRFHSLPEARLPFQLGLACSADETKSRQSRGRPVQMLPTYARRSACTDRYTLRRERSQSRLPLLSTLAASHHEATNPRPSQAAPSIGPHTCTRSQRAEAAVMPRFRLPQSKRRRGGGQGSPPP